MINESPAKPARLVVGISVSPGLYAALPHIIAIGVACTLILLLTKLLQPGSKLALFLLDHGPNSFFVSVYPFTIQNVMHILTAIGLAEVFVRWRHTRSERAFRRFKLLPEDHETVLQHSDLGPIRRKLVEASGHPALFMPKLVDLCLVQLITTKSVDQAVAIYTSTVELISHRLDLSYQTIRYLVWLIPTIGFIGTVVGIAISLEGLDNPKQIDFPKITAGLSVAFYTTILALLQSVLIVFLMNVTQRSEELALNDAADYCLKNLINRYYAEDHKT